VVARISSMRPLHSFLLLSTLLNCLRIVLCLGTTCKAPLGPGLASPTDPFWMQNIKHQGTSSYNPNPTTYQVFRNVKASYASHMPYSCVRTNFSAIRILEPRAMVSRTTLQPSSKAECPNPCTFFTNLFAAMRLHLEVVAVAALADHLRMPL
jgi:hypothetical protein